MNTLPHIEETPFIPRALQGAASTFKFVPVADLECREPEFTVDGLIETETLGMIFGDPGCGKSFLAVDLALSVATGADFHEHPTKKGAVFFIAGEGHNGLARRFTAWSKARDIQLAGVPLFKSERAAQFLDSASAKAVNEAVAQLTVKHGAPALIIIDTLARNFGPGDENNTKEMSEFVTAIDDMKALFPGCCVLIVHHSGHGDKQRARGAMALKGALDFEFRVEKKGSAVQLINTKMKDAEAPKDMFFSFRQVELDGNAKSAVLDSTEAPEPKLRLTTNQRLAQATYGEAAIKHAVWDKGAFRGVHVDDWRTFFYAKHTGDNKEAKQKAFQRARLNMTDNGMMAVQDDVYLTLDAGLQTSIMDRADGQDIAGHS
jgi:hypothetical protein